MSQSQDEAVGAWLPAKSDMAAVVVATGLMQ